MTVTVDKISNAGGNARLVRFSSDIPGAVFSLYLSGTLIASTRQQSRVIGIEPGAATTLEIRDDQSGPGATANSEPPSHAAEATVELTWQPIAGAKAYRIEENISGVWNHTATVPAEPDGVALGQLKHRTTPLAEDAAASFRITSIGADGNEGSAANFTVSANRHPDPPNAIYDYDQPTSAITITEIT